MRLLRQGMWVLACAAVAGAGPALAELRLTRSVELSETYSDNVDQERDGEEDSALLSDATTVLDLRYRAARARAAFDSATTVRYQSAGEDEGIQVLPRVSGFGNVEVSEDVFFVDASAAISRELLDTRERDTQANRDLVQTYRLSPYLVGRFGGFAHGQVRYSASQVFRSGDGDGGGGLSDTTRHEVSGFLAGGPDFTRLLWNLNARASRSERSESNDVERADASLGVEYVVAPSFSLLGSVGYQRFDDGNEANEIDSPTWRGGFRWRPGPRTSLRATYGRRDETESFDATLRYRLGPRTTLTASYLERLTTGDERLVRDLSFIETDPVTGELIDTRTGLPFDPNTAATSLVDTTRRTKTFHLAVRGTRGRNTFVIDGRVESSEEEGGVGPADDEMGYRLVGTWGRELSQRSSLRVTGRYERGEFEIEDRTDDEISATGTLRYVVYRAVQAFAGYSYRQQFSTDDDEEFTENRVTVGVRMAF